MANSAIQLNTPTSFLFVGNSYTFGRVDPVMSYNTANVRDLTSPARGGTFANTTGSNPYEPHPWGGVPGIFARFANEVGLTTDVAISARNAATLQGHYLNSNPAGWDLRGNVASQSWDTVVLQDNSTQALPSGSGSIAFAPGSSTATLTLRPRGDTKIEADEVVGLKLAGGNGYRVGSTGTISATILNDDPSGPTNDPALPTVTLAASPSATLEGSGSLVYTFTRTGSLDGPLRVTFGATRDGPSSPSVNTTTGDFAGIASSFTTSFAANGTTTTGRLSFTDGGGYVDIPAGAASATFTLNSRSDADVEADESLYLSLTGNGSYNVGTPGSVAATILNDDYAPGTDFTLPSISLSATPSAVYENSAGEVVYTFSRTGPIGSALTVNFDITGTATVPGQDFDVLGAETFRTAGAPSPDLVSFQTYALKLANYATVGAADGTIAANPNANNASNVYLYETWARPNLVTGARVATTDETTGAITTTGTTAPEYYATLEDMTADLRAAYRGLAAANPVFDGVAPVGEAFLNAVQQGVAIRDPYSEDASSTGRVNLWWDDNLHASKYGSYLSALTLFGQITGLDPRSLGAADVAAAELGVTRAEAAALQNVAAATLGISLQASWTAPGQVTELENATAGLLATAGAFSFSDADTADTHTVSVAPVTAGNLGTLTATVRADSTGDGTGGAINWAYTVDDSAVEYLDAGQTRIERFLLTVSDGRGGDVQREIGITINGTYDAVVTPPINPTNPSAGDDNLVGTSGPDTISLGLGNDTFAGGAGADLAYGNQGNDLIYGNQDADTLYGGQGDDRAYGGQGDDRLYGNLGNDVLSGNLGADVVYGNQGNDLVYGNQGADILFGGQGNDVLYGGQDADTLVGGIGDDTLVGGLGADLYRFDPSSGRDLILGFNQGEGDRIALGGQTYTVSSAQNGDAMLTLSGGGVVDLVGVRADRVNASYFAV